MTMLVSDDIYKKQLTESNIYLMLKIKCANLNDDVSAHTLSIVNRIVSESCQLSKMIIKYMPEYTLHDETHLFRVLLIMERLIPEQTLNKLSVPELMMLILVAFLHDIGMAPSDEMLISWKKLWKIDEPTEIQISEYNKFIRFRDTYTHKIQEIYRLRSNEEHKKADLVEDYIISEYIRKTHVNRAREIIANNWAADIYYENKNLASELIQLCFSHGENSLSLLDLETNVMCSENNFICMPFIGVILRLADLLDFDAKRTPSILFSHLSVKNEVSLKEWQKHRAVQSWIIRPDKIAFHASCSHPAIEKSINEFCDQIDKELINCSNVLSRISDDFRKDMEIYNIQIPIKVDRTKIHPERDLITNEPLYIYEDTAFELSKDQIIDLLMGTKLYDDTKAALRELIQNSIDACLITAALYQSFDLPYNPQIVIRYYTEGSNDILEVEDNGIGMNKDIINNYYSKIGSSYYKSNEFYDLRAQTNLSFEPISRFGIGILSCFMVSDTIEVTTRKLLENGDKDKAYSITIEGYDSIFTLRAGNRKNHGTNTRLQLRKKENPWETIRNENFINYVKDAIPNPPVPIRIEVDKDIDAITMIDQDSFFQCYATSLRNYQWDNEDYIKEIKINFNDEQKGLRGNAIIGILQHDDKPIDMIENLNRTVTIDNEDYDLENKIVLKKNEVEKISTVIEVDIDSGIDTKNSTSTIVKSKSKFSIHGINFPDGLFPDFFGRNKKAKIRWCLPMLLVVDIIERNDVDLNSARTELIYNDKWNRFEADLAEIILSKLKEQLEVDYWVELKEILTNSESSEIFIEAINKI